MPPARAVLFAAVAATLLLAGAARANEADDAILTLTAKAREQARGGDSEGLAATLGDIIDMLPRASSDGVAAVSGLNSYLATANLAQQGQAPASPPTGPTAAEPSRPGPTGTGAQPGQEAPAPSPAPLAPAADVARPPAPAAAAPPDADGEPAEPAQPSVGQRPAAVASRTIPLPVTPAPATPPSAQPAPASPAPAGMPRPAAPKALVEALRRSADAALATGDVSAARRYYQRAAEGGCAPCAEALARTYEADQLRRIGAVGIRPDPQQAEAWRARARQLQQAGSP